MRRLCDLDIKDDAFVEAWRKHAEGRDGGWVPVWLVASELGVNVVGLCFWIYEVGVHVVSGIEMSGSTCEDALVRIVRDWDLVEKAVSEAIVAVILATVVFMAFFG